MTRVTRGSPRGIPQYVIFQCVGCSHTCSWSPQNRLYVVLGSRPRISLSSWIRKENVDTDVPMKNLQSDTRVTGRPNAPGTVTATGWPGWGPCRHPAGSPAQRAPQAWHTGRPAQ